MREIDFLPQWYPAVRRQRSILRAQVWASAVIVSAGVVALTVSYQQCEAAQRRFEVTREHADRSFRCLSAMHSRCGSECSRRSDAAAR